MNIERDLEERIIEKYNETKSYTKVSKIFNINRKYISKILKNNGISRYFNRYFDFCKEDICKWADLYHRCKSIDTVSKKFGVSSLIITKCFKKHNIKIWGPRKHTCDFNFFNKDTPESFYWAGFIAADGSIDENRNVLKINISSKDMGHLYKFRNIIKFTGNIYFYKSTKGFNKECNSMSAVITICSKDIIYGLKRFNISNRKSLTYYMPEWILCHPLLNHFLRGYIDGDGCYYINRKYKSGHIKLGNNVCGTILFLDQLRKTFNEKCGTYMVKIVSPKNNKISYLNYCGNKNVKAISEYLFVGSNNTIVLDRKAEFLNKYKNVGII